MPIVRKRRDVSTTALPGARRTAAETVTSQGGAVAAARARTFETIGQIGQAGANLGVRIGGRIEAERRRAAEEEKNRADQVAVISAESRLAQWERDRVYDPQKGALTQKGQAAFTLPETIDEEFEKVAGEIEATLGTPEQKAAFVGVRARRGQQVGLTIRRHVYGEIQTYEAGELKARLDNAVDIAIANAHDPRRAGEELGRAEQAIRTMGPRIGLGPEQIEQQVDALWSAGVTGIIDRLLANDQVNAAQVYYDEQKSMIAGDQLARIEKALETGQLRKEGQTQADAIIRAGGTLAEWREKARAIDDAATRDEVMQRVEHEGAVVEKIKQDDDETRMRRAADVVDRTKSVAGIPTSDLSKMSLGQRSSLRSYAKQLAEGTEPETDFPTLYRLFQQAGDDPQAFAKVNLLDHLDKLGKQDREQLAQLQLSIRNADRKSADAVIDGFMTNQQIVNDALLSVGLDPTPAPGSENVDAVIRLRREVDRQVQALQTRTGKKATNQDVQGIVDELLTSVTTVKGTGKMIDIFTSQPYRDVQKRLADVTLADMPATLKQQAIESLRGNGQVVSDAALLSLYRRYLIKQQAK